MFRKAVSSDIALIKELAHQIWPHSYGQILTSAQLEYMLDFIYSETALQKQMNEGQQFIIAYINDEPVGFAAYSLLDNMRSVFKLHKIYILPSTQGTGLGKKLLCYIIDIVKSSGGRILTLNVNRHNKAKDFYTKLGFKIIKEEDVPIGHNYFMNDYIMEKDLTAN
ncbi:MAG: family N-acetyltransferase [Chitinophagaceae bacterium]|nr:family N-acetyltransferase [Chitinophagaceae bacterium]